MKRIWLASRTITATWTHPPITGAAARVPCATGCGDRVRLDDARTTMADTHTMSDTAPAAREITLGARRTLRPGAKARS